MAAKKAKLQDQFLEDAAKEGCSHSIAGSSIFQGVAIFVNGYTGVLLGYLLEYTMILAKILCRADFVVCLAFILSHYRNTRWHIANEFTSSF
jgi:hypothetical protein